MTVRRVSDWTGHERTQRILWHSSKNIMAYGTDYRGLYSIYTFVQLLRFSSAIDHHNTDRQNSTTTTIPVAYMIADGLSLPASTSQQPLFKQNIAFVISAGQRVKVTVICTKIFGSSSRSLANKPFYLQTIPILYYCICTSRCTVCKLIHDAT